MYRDGHSQKSKENDKIKERNNLKETSCNCGGPRIQTIWDSRHSHKRLRTQCYSSNKLIQDQQDGRYLDTQQH